MDNNNQGSVHCVSIHEGEAELGAILETQIFKYFCDLCNTNVIISFSFIILCLVNVCLQKLPIDITGEGARGCLWWKSKQEVEKYF